MGGSESKQNNNSSSTSVPVKSSNNKNTSKSSLTHVYLNVYKAKESHISLPGFGIYHSGVELYDTEYMFADTGNSLSGIINHRPKTQDKDSPWEYYQTLDLGETQCKRDEIRLIINELNPQWIGNKYDLTAKNCNHFSEALCVRLGLNNFPGWVNRAAKVSNPFKSAFSTSNNNKNNNNNNNNANQQQAVGFNPEFDDRPVTAADHAALILESVENMELITAGLIDTNKVACLNEHKTHNIQEILNPKNRIQSKYYLESDSDSQLLIFIPFVKSIKLVGFQIQLSLKHLENHPKTIKLYINQNNLDFNDVNNNTVKLTQLIELKSLLDIEEDPRGSLAKITKNPQSKQEKKQHIVTIHIPTKAALFHQVSSLCIFIESNISDTDLTIVHGFDFFGRPSEKK